MLLQVWKRSGAWFYKAIPKYVLPLKILNKTEIHLRNIQAEPPQIQELRTATMNRTYTWAKGRGELAIVCFGTLNVLHIISYFLLHFKTSLISLL